MTQNKRASQIQTLIIVFLCALVVVQAVINRNLRYKYGKARFLLYTPSDANIKNQKSPVLPVIGLTDMKTRAKTTVYDLLGEKKTILFVFSTDCYSCDQVSGLWNEIYDEYNGAFTIAGISRDAVSGIENYVSRNNARFPVFRYEEAVGIDPFGSLPLTLVLDKSGSIKLSLPGYSKEIKLKIQEELK